MLLHPASWSEVIHTPPSFFSQENSTPWRLVFDTLRLSDPHQRYWYDGLGSVLAALLENAGYSQKRQVETLSHFATLVAPFLGRAPTPDLPRWPSFMTDDHTPVELSLDFHTGNQLPTVRYSFEPIALDAGAVGNPNNAGAATKFKNVLLQRFPATDSRWFDHFESSFNVPNDSKKIGEGHPSMVFWAFDLTSKGASPKAYFFPGLVARATNRTNLETILDAIVSAPGFQSSSFPSLQIYSQYAHDSLRYNHELDMLALDLEPLEKARLKIYFRDRRTSFASVRENMSLGGRLSDVEFDRGMQHLRTLWNALFHAEWASEDTNLPHNDHRTAGVLYNVEFRVDRKGPLVKIYIPVRHYAQSDGQVSKVLESYMSDELGHGQGVSAADNNAEVYRRCINQTFKPELLQSGLGVHTYIGCSIQGEGRLRVVAYFNPQESKIQR